MKICADLKIFKVDNNNIKKELDAKCVAIKSAVKDGKDATKSHEKDIKRLENEIKTLLEYKILKTSEEKDLKNKLKKANKKLKNLEEKEAKLLLDKLAFEKTKTEVLLKESKEEVEHSEDQETFACDSEAVDENSNTLKPFNQEAFSKIAKEMEYIDKKVACFVESIHEFMFIEPADDPNSTVLKLKLSKNY